MAGPIPYPESPRPESSPQQPFPQSGMPQHMPYPGHVPSAYPGALPPPVDYPPPPRGRRLVVGSLSVLVIVLAIALVTAIVMDSRRADTASTVVTDASATSAIQGYLDALTKGDEETVARNNSCGFYDAVADRQTDMALAKLGSDAFRRQYEKATVSSIDKIVTWSDFQAQVLFTMRATPAGRSNGQVQRQGIAQLLSQDGKILVCSYLPRDTGQF